MGSVTCSIGTVETGSCRHGSWRVEGARWWPLTRDQDPALCGWQTGHRAQSQLGLQKHGWSVESWRDLVVRVGRRTEFFFPRAFCNLWQMTRSSVREPPITGQGWTWSGDQSSAVTPQQPCCSVPDHFPSWGPSVCIPKLTTHLADCSDLFRFNTPQISIWLEEKRTLSLSVFNSMAAQSLARVQIGNL